VRFAEGDAACDHLRGAGDDEQRLTILLQLRALMRLAGILDGERMQAELRLHAAEQILARLKQADPYHVAGAHYPGAGLVDGNVRHAFAIGVDAGVDHPRFGADVKAGGLWLHRSDPVWLTPA
jgi:hypothetical protein